MRLPLLLLTLAPLAAFAQSETPPREHYQPIVDAKPFGDVAKQVSAEEAAKAAEEQKQKEEIAQKFRMVGITDYPDGTRKIAFLDETQGVASYLLGIGESENGFTLVEADYDAEWATLTKDGLTFTLGLGKGLIEKPDPEEEAAPLAPLAPAARRVLPQASAQSAVAKPAAKPAARLARRLPPWPCFLSRSSGSLRYPSLKRSQPSWAVPTFSLMLRASRSVITSSMYSTSSGSAPSLSSRKDWPFSSSSPVKRHSYEMMLLMPDEGAGLCTK